MIYQRVVISRCLYFAMLAAPIIIGISMLLFFSRLLSDVTSNALPISHLGYFLLLTIIKYLPHLLILSGFIGIFISFYHFSQQNEIHVWHYAGLGLHHFIKPILYFAVPIALIVAFFSFEVSPWAVRSIKSARINSVLSINPENFARNQFIGIPGGEHVLFWNDNGNIFIANQSPTANNIIITKHLSQKNNQSFQLEKGNLYYHNQKDETFEKMTFNSFELGLPTSDEIIISARGKKITDLDLSLNKDIAELIWRINLPLMTLILLVSALYLSVNIQQRPKNSSYFFALILFFFSISQLDLTKDLMEVNKIPVLFGLIAPHCMTLAAVFLIYRYLKR